MTWPCLTEAHRGGQPVKGRGWLLTLLSVLGAGAEVDYLEQFGILVSTQYCCGPAAWEQALRPWRRRPPGPRCSHSSQRTPAPSPQTTWLRPQRHVLRAGLP